MASKEVEEVLANWIAEAQSPQGKLPEGIVPSRWVAQMFLRWWKGRAADEVDNAESAVTSARAELDRLGGWSNPHLGEALHELIHATDALAGLRSILGLDEVGTRKPA